MMPMNYDTAKLIFDCAQDCVSRLNSMLKRAQSDLPDAEFKRLKLSVAQAMGSLVDVCESNVYLQHPSLRPYNVDGRPT
jgi:hypothetical protein